MKWRYIETVNAADSRAAEAVTECVVNGEAYFYVWSGDSFVAAFRHEDDDEIFVVDCTVKRYASLSLKAEQRKRGKVSDE